VQAGKAERLFRAAVSAFCALTRPSRRDALQLDDLSLPLFEFVSVETRRYVAAALSECQIAPRGLVRLLAEQSIDVAAPILMRSPILSDAELIAIVGSHGATHARAIARRTDLAPAIAYLIRALESSLSAQPQPAQATQRDITFGEDGDQDIETAIGSVLEINADDEAKADIEQNVIPPRGAAAEAMRERLRQLMRPVEAELDEVDEAVTLATSEGPSSYQRLRDAALSGNKPVFHTALGDALKINLATAKMVTESPSAASLIAALRALELREEQAFVIASAVFPKMFPHPEAVRLFLERFRALSAEAAIERVRGWKVEMVATWIRANGASDNTVYATPIARPAEAIYTPRRVMAS